MADSVWLTVAGVSAFLQDDGDPATPENSPALQQACNASAEYVEGKHPSYFDTEDPPVYVPPADIKLGAVMLAARLYQRRGSILGVAGFSDFGGSPLLRQDPDIARLLRLGQHATFDFGAPPLPVVEEEPAP